MYFYLTIPIILIFLYMHLETRHLMIERIKVSKSKNTIKIAQLSDIHIGNMFVSFTDIKAALEKENPDIIILSGDYIERPNQIPKFFKFLDTLPKKPVYACFGNHDYKAFLNNNNGLKRFAEQLKAKGITLLRNQNTSISVNGRIINIVGIEDIRYKKHDIKNAFCNIENSKNITIAFSHNPDILFFIGKNKTDLLLTGHFHGGQIWLPFHLEFKLLRKEKLSRMKIYKGLNTIDNNKIYISRGLGNVVFPLRLFSKPEITFFEV